MVTCHEMSQRMPTVMQVAANTSSGAAALRTETRVVRAWDGSAGSTRTGTAVVDSMAGQ